MSKAVKAVVVTVALLVMVSAVALLAVYIYSHNMFNVQCLVEHDMAVIAAKPATCTANGCTEGAYCKRCGKVFIESKAIDAHGHTTVVTKGVSPNCVTDGKTDKKHCSVCGYVIAPQTTVPALGHDWERNPDVYIEQCHCGMFNPVQQALTAEEIYKKCAPAVCLVFAYDSSGTLISAGSGFFINIKGDVMTNYHVISMARSFEIMTSAGEKYAVDGIFDYDPQADWAVLHINASNKSFTYLNFGEESSIVNGATVYAIGNPLGVFTSSITQGIISNNNRVINDVKYIQMSTAISHGSSGGALINQYGEVVGITTGSIEQGQDLNLSVPIPEKLRKSLFNIYRVLDSGDMVQQAKSTFFKWLNSFKNLKAFDEVAQWIKLNPSFLSNGKSVYCDIQVEEDTPSYCYINSEPNGDLRIMFLLIFDEQQSFSLKYTITNNANDLNCAYSFFDNNDLVGSGYFYSPTFYPDQEIVFDKYTGIVFEDIRQEYERICASFITVSLSTLEDLIVSKMKSSTISMESFGFFSFY